LILTERVAPEALSASSWTPSRTRKQSR